MKSATENNRLIAEFMGFKSTNKCIISESGKYYDFFAHERFNCIKEQEIQIESQNGFGLVEQDFLFISDLKFQSDWNWLMEVVEKIDSVLPDDSFVTIEFSSCWIPIYEGGFDIIGKGATKIERTYNAVVEFIKWYNENK